MAESLHYLWKHPPAVQASLRKIEIIFKSTVGLACFHVIRLAERRLSKRSFYLVFRTLFTLRAASTLLFRRSRSDARSTMKEIVRGNTNRYMNLMLKYFPDRLSEEKWRGHCRFEGLDHLRESLKQNRPVLLAFRHSGTYQLIHLWLRSVGIPVAPLVVRKVKKRPRLNRRLDLVDPLPGVPNVFYLDQLRRVQTFLAEGNALLIAIDFSSEKMVEIPYRENRVFRMATGAFRIANHHDAEVYPCSIVDEECWQFTIRLAAPVPAQFIQPQPDFVNGGTYLLDKLR